MVQPVNRASVLGAVAALAVAGAALLWHLLACVESPMAWTPKGDQLFFVTIEPYGERSDAPFAVRGTHNYRLMVLDKDGKLRVLEETTEYMLCAPSCRPDGGGVSYFRIPLLTPEGLAQLEKCTDQRSAALAAVAACAWPSSTAPDSAPTVETRPAARAASDRGLPSIEKVDAVLRWAAGFPRCETKLVTRALDDGAVVSTTPVELVVADEELGFVMPYLALRPQYSPDGRYAYFCTAGLAARVVLSSGELEYLAAPALAVALAPDGATLAVLAENSIGLVQTDGSSALYRRVEEKISRAGIAWIDNRTLALLEDPSSDEPRLHVHLVKREDATRTRTIEIPFPKPARSYRADAHTGSLAWAPDGKHMVVAFQHDVFFLTTGGALLHHWRHDADQLVQPTFSPDSKRVAFKLMHEEPDAYPRAAAILVLAPDGREISRVPIPRIDPTTTHPVSTQPADES